MQSKYTIKFLGLVDYAATLELMQNFTKNRNNNSKDEFWILEHNQVFTLGMAAKESHILNKDHNIQIIKTDRGGQVTYHAPGQIVIYTLIDIERLKISVKSLVMKLEQGIINYLNTLNIHASRKDNAPGVYINNKKIASLGLRIKSGCTYHGISFNLEMNKIPFNYINVCGIENLEIIQLADIINIVDKKQISVDLTTNIINELYRID